MSSSKLAIDHWNKTPLFISEEERYSLYPWLYEAAEFKSHAGHHWGLHFENSRDPVHIDLYTARKLRRLLAPAKVTVEKFCCLPAPRVPGRFLPGR